MPNTSRQSDKLKALREQCDAYMARLEAEGRAISSWRCPDCEYELRGRRPMAGEGGGGHCVLVLCTECGSYHEVDLYSDGRAIVRRPKGRKRTTVAVEVLPGLVPTVPVPREDLNRLAATSGPAIKWFNVMLYEMQKLGRLSANGPADRDIANFKRAVEVVTGWRNP